MWPFRRKPQEPKQACRCAQCSKEFLVKVKRIADSKSGLVFCSTICSGAYQSAQKSLPNAQCRTCGKAFHRSPANFRESNTHAYCSKGCYAEARKAGIAEVRRPVDASEHPATCQQCGKDFVIRRSPFGGYRGRKYCSDECRHQSQITSRVHVSRNILKARKSCCELCGLVEPEILEVHHIDRNRRNNRDDNLLLICPNCHRKIHRGGKGGKG